MPNGAGRNINLAPSTSPRKCLTRLGSHVKQGGRQKNGRILEVLRIRWTTEKVMINVFLPAALRNAGPEQSADIAVSRFGTDFQIDKAFVMRVGITLLPEDLD